VRKVFVVLVTLILASFIFAAGSVSLRLNPNASWSQTLTFSVRQWIKVTWDYDETQAFAIDDTSYTATVGNIEFRSNKRFKLYYGIGNTLPSGVNVTSVKVGSVVLSNSSTTPTEVSTKLLSGVLEIGFNSEVLNVENDFSVKFDFTFLPF
jgi:hypothetical protein